MSKVTISGNASGTGTLLIAAPNTNSDITLNLPTTMGTNNGSSVVTTDAAGNLGLGVAPSAWDVNARALQIRNGAALYDLNFGGASTYTFLANNSYRSTGGTDRYLNTYAASLYFQNNGVHAWYNAPSGTAGAAITFTQAMILDASGNLGVGKITPSVKLDVSSSSSQVARITTDANGAYGALWIFNSNANNECSIAYRDSTDSNETMWVVGKAVNGVDLFGWYYGGARMSLDTGGNLTLNGATATKASGTTWANPSDQRLKDNIRDYTKGSAELMQIRVCEWEYNGKGGTTEGMKGLGVIADEAMLVLPGTVDTYDAKLNSDDEETTAIKKFDATEITWLLVKTVQELKAIVDAQGAEIATLKGKA